MHIDLYTKAILTVIAMALVTIAARDLISPARAQIERCSDLLPCTVKVKGPVQVFGPIETYPLEPRIRPK